MKSFYSELKYYLRQTKRLVRLGRPLWSRLIVFTVLSLVLASWQVIISLSIVFAAISIIPGGAGKEGHLTKVLHDLSAALPFKADPAVISIIAALGALLIKSLIELGVMAWERNLYVRLMTVVRSRVLNNFLAAHQWFLDGFKSSQLLQIILAECRQTSQALLLACKLATDSFGLLVHLAILFLINARLTILVLIGATTIALGKFIYSRIVIRTSIKALKERTLFWKQFANVCSGLKHIKLTGVSKQIADTFQRLSFKSEFLVQQEKLLRKAETPIIQAQGILLIAVVFIVAHSGALWIGTPMAMATIISFLVVLQRMVPIVDLISLTLTTIYQSFPVVEMVWDQYEFPPERRESTGSKTKQPLLEDRIVLDRVSLSYNGEDKVLKDISLNVAKGERIGLVGPSGSGKSSLVHLLLKLYEPTSGNITIDGIGLDEIITEDVRRNIGLVCQDLHLFDQPIRDTITMAGRDNDTKALEEAARKAFAQEFIEALPHGYDTLAGERGTLLSGGERQRLLIAQVFYKDPEIIIFDEATSALDGISEQAICESLYTMDRDKTLIVIAHRLSSLKHVDRIYVLDKGRVVESGTWDELLAREGLMWRMAQHQAVAATGTK